MCFKGKIKEKLRKNLSIIYEKFKNNLVNAVPEHPDSDYLRFQLQQQQMCDGGGGGGGQNGLLLHPGPPPPPPGGQTVEARYTLTNLDVSSGGGGSSSSDGTS
jgi:hypothetical protein